ncbi:MAG: protein kinase [Gemmatimonadota bacterium]
MTETFTRLTAALADRYTLERELGQGGMATVYLAEDIKHKRKVAIKVLKPELAAVLGAERFVQEITTTAALQHPHILPLFDSGAADGFLWYAMPFIDGETLRGKLDRETQLGVDDAVKLTCDVADALHYAHSKGVIHRDIKPENILLANGRPMVADFGIALAVSAAAGGRMTETGLSLGTPHYMSPEQATAEKEISNRSDIYSLASVCYEMLAGQPPHLGGSAQQIIMKIIAEQAAPVTQMRKAVPANVAAALSKALEKLPADRFEDAQTFARALQDPNFTTARLSATAAATGGTSRWRAALVGGLILGAALGAMAVRRLAPRAAALGSSTREQRTFSGEATMPAISPDGTRIAFVVSNCGRLKMTGEECHAALHTMEVGSTVSQILIPAALELGYPQWSYDGETVVVAGALDASRVGLFAIGRLTATPRLLMPGTFRAYATHPSADSMVVLLSAADSMVVVGLTDGEQHDRIAIRASGAEGLAWSQDGRRIATIGDQLRIFDRAGTLLDSMAVSARASVRWGTADESLIYFRVGKAREDELVRHAVTKDGSLAPEAVVILPRTPTLYEGEFDIARQTGDLVIATGDAISDIWSFDLTQRPVVAVRNTKGTTWYGGPALSLDGRSLYYFRGDALGDNIYTLDRRTGEERALTAQTDPGGNHTRFASDGRRFAFGHASSSGESIHYIDLPSEQVHFAQAPSVAGQVVPLVPNGFLTVAGTTGGLIAYDSLGAVPRTLTGPDVRFVGSFAASNDGRLVFFAAMVDSLALPVLAVMPVAGGPMTVLRTLEARDIDANITVTRDGTLYLGRWLLGDKGPSLWRIAPAGGAWTPVVDIPVSCRTGSLVVNADATVATCTAFDIRSDVWTVKVGSATR